MALTTRQEAVTLFFGLTAHSTAGELAALGAREETTVAEALQDDDDGHRIVALEGSSRGRERLASEDAVVRVAQSSTDDGDPRPATRHVTPRTIGAVVQQRRRRHARRTPQRRRVATTSLAQHGRGVPGRRPRVAIGLVVGVDNDGATDLGHRRERRAPGADDDRPARAHSVPLVLPGGDVAPSLFQTTPQTTGPRLGRYEDQQRALFLPGRFVGGENQSQGVRRRGDLEHPRLYLVDVRQYGAREGLRLGGHGQFGDETFR